MFPSRGSILLVDDEENVVAAIHWELDDVELVGGSAGDGISFQRTAMIHNGRVAQRAAVLMMIETEFPFRVFKTQNFEPTGIKLVVTPHVTDDRHVSLLLHTERSAVRTVADQELGFIVETQQADNQLLVADGQTAVIGGLTVTEVTKTRSGIPMLSQLPLLGPLFSFSSCTSTAGGSPASSGWSVSSRCANACSVSIAAASSCMIAA